ncbi:QRFP-like peptide receptor [Lytechinus variegatus]|uniref:QRFP-like peptide receptor n=1 Tax=Lytechinus variegatus TaxID=7654 RepID=UPI001BB2CF82|nr:QRFP-like peptide receptor [Lytechinus variegatus]
MGSDQVSEIELIADSKIPQESHGEISIETTSNISGLPFSDWLWNPVTWSWWEILQTAIASLGVVGNSLVVIVLFQRRTTRRPADTLIGALAAADLLTSLFMFPHPTPQNVPVTFLGNFVCKLVKSSALLWVSCSASIFTLTAIAVERCIAVVFPLRAKRLITRRRVSIVVGIIWCSSCVCVAPEFVFHVVEPLSHNCIYRYQSTIIQEIYGIFVIVIFFLLPSSVMLAVHVLIVTTLHRQTRRFASSVRNHRSSPAYRNVVAKKRAVKLLFIIVVMYIICWAPNTFAYLAVSMQWLDASFIYSPPYEALVALAFLNSCVNPVIYSIHCPEFRKALREILTRKTSSTIRVPLFGQDFNGNLQRRESIRTIYLTKRPR